MTTKVILASYCLMMSVALLVIEDHDIVVFSIVYALHLIASCFIKSTADKTHRLSQPISTPAFMLQKSYSR